ncbi:hypothetical protein CMI48_01815 [Candidatus Pacearchaeota archaeon]|nr:hypothetical protein [Candidatus Pacearchaeota archaeon]
MAFDFKKMFGKDDEEEFLEIDVNNTPKEENKVQVKPFVLKNFDDANHVLSALRDGYTIAVIDINPLKKKDVIELKRAVAKVKKTVDAMSGSIAGFGENTLIATPQFAEIHKTHISQDKPEKTDFIGGSGTPAE